MQGNNEQNDDQSPSDNSHSAHGPASHAASEIEGKISKCHDYPLIIAR